MTKHIVFLYADTGGGHRATAQAAEKALHLKYGAAYSTELLNAIHFLPYPFNQMEKAYPIFVNSLAPAYLAFWKATNTRPYVDLSRRYLEVTGRTLGKQLLSKHPADLYVSCQPILNQFVPGIVKHYNAGTKVIAVVSDLVTVHAGFWSPKVDHFTVPTEQARDLAIANHVPASAITVTGQPVTPDFAARVQHGHSMHAELGLTSQLPLALLIGGGDGMGRLVPTAMAIAHSGLPIQLAVVCGRNEAARRTVSAIQAPMPVTALGFCTNIPEWMGAANILITKAGPGTICEGFIAGLPIILYDAVPGQESGNINLVVEQHAGAWCPAPEKVVDQLRLWLTTPALLHQAGQASAALAKPDSALAIAEVIHRFAQSKAESR